ncbi:MAG: hypothetical protein Q8N60_05800 [Candidatus Diapherotrites archaeon]|nr:hypothetical protein [Candidatus Diapherotrites archaeon]
MAKRVAGKKSAGKGRAGKKAKPAAVSKVVKRDIKSLQKGLKKEISLTKKVSRKAGKQENQLDLLAKEIEKLKKKKKRSALSEYNKFMRQQIRKGLSFKQAVREWNKRKKALAKKTKKPTAYNVFVSMQLKQGKTMKQAIAAWNRLKNPAKRKRPARKKFVIAKPKAKALKKRPAKRKRAKPRKKPVKRRIAKPRKKRVLRRKLPVAKPRRIVRRITVEKPVIVAKQVFPKEEIVLLIEKAIEKLSSSEKRVVVESKAISAQKGEELCDEEVALRMLNVYFSEIARYGLKRKLTLDEVINAYFYALLRIERKGIEINEIKEAMLRKGM